MLMVMHFEIFLTVIAVAISTCIASPTSSKSRLLALSTPPNQSGFHDGFYYTWWTDGQANATYTNGPGGSYSVSWANGKGDLYGGKGWETTSLTRVASYKGTFQPVGNGYLELYGFTKNPVTEYRVMDSYGTYNPAASYPVKGTISCNGANYDVVRVVRYPQGFEPTIYQFYSIRNPRLPLGEVSGTIDFGCHVSGWASFGMNLGTVLNFQILATDAYFSSGSSNITVF